MKQIALLGWTSLFSSFGYANTCPTIQGCFAYQLSHGYQEKVCFEQFGCEQVNFTTSMAGITSKTSNWLIDGVMRPSGTLGDVTFNDSYAFKNLSLVNTSDRTDAATGKLLSHCIERFTNQGHGLIDDFTCWNPQGHRDEHEYKVLDRISSE